ncbi:MAG: hypothetical protein BGO78_10535 [Chloroflexi bacterium 44-23]|nr:MAG: hypothetical protein BGO78_10535 [Chloroflexi bacterium 44-23]
MKNQSDQEIEAKFYVLNLPAIQESLLAQGAKLIQDRVFEVNLRFDEADGKLRDLRNVLRLRRDTQNILTFKGAAEAGKDVSVRQEIEVVVDDFDTTRRLLEALGYEVIMQYEKFRTTYSFMKTLVVLDELPYGHFVEIEGPNGSAIKKAAIAIGLEWRTRASNSYVYMFENLQSHHPEFADRNLTFSDLHGLRVSADELGIHPADLQERHR